MSQPAFPHYLIRERDNLRIHWTSSKWIPGVEIPKLLRCMPGKLSRQRQFPESLWQAFSFGNARFWCIANRPTEHVWPHVYSIHSIKLSCCSTMFTFNSLNAVLSAILFTLLEGPRYVAAGYNQENMTSGKFPAAYCIAFFWSLDCVFEILDALYTCTLKFKNKF